MIIILIVNEGLQGFEIMGLAAVGNNLITYVINEMHFSLSKSANIVTNFIGTVFLLALLGGYLSDSFLGCFWTALIFAFLELSVYHFGFLYLSPYNTIPKSCLHSSSTHGSDMVVTNK